MNKGKLYRLLALALTLAMLLSVASVSLATGYEGATELVMMYANTAGEQPDSTMIWEAINKILVEKLNCYITPMALSTSSLNEQTTVMLAGNEQLDLMTVLDAAKFTSYASKGQLIELDALLAEYGQGIVEAVGTGYLAAAVVNGETFAVPTLRDLATTKCIFVDQVYAEKYNVTPETVKTMDDMAAVYAQIVADEPGVYPMGTMASLQNMLIEALGKIDPMGDYMGVLLNYGQDETLSLVNWFATEEYASWCAYFHDWYQKGYINKDTLTTSETFFEQVKSGKAASMWLLGKPGATKQFSTTVGKPLVQIELSEAFSSTSTVQGGMWAIPHNCSNPELAMQVLNEFYTNADIVNIFCNGIEGVHYVKTADGQITYPDGVDATNVGYKTNSAWLVGNQFLSYTWVGDPATLWDEMKAFNDSAIRSKAFGFVFDNGPVKTQVAAVTNVINEYRPGLEYGALDPATALPEFIQKLTDAGIDEIIAEKQRQLDAWLATK